MIQKITSNEIYERTMRVIAPLPCQQTYIRQLSTILSMHIHKNCLLDEGYLVDDLPAVSAIVVAPTGQGKTYLLRKMAECLDINLIVIDCSSLAAEGWKGVSLTQRLLSAKKESSNKKAFARSILFLDEIDKLRFWGNDKDQGNPISNILQLYNQGYITAEDSKSDSVRIDVRRFTILLSGAFDGIEKIIEKRLSPTQKIGFGRETDLHSYSLTEQLQQVTMEDLRAYGILPELLGRVGTILTIPPLSLEDYRQLLAGGVGSTQQQYQNYLNGLYGVTLVFTDTAVESIAQMCMSSGSGTRAVSPIVNDLMRNVIVEVEQNAKINQVIIDANERSLLFVQYEYGDRDYCRFNYSVSKLPTLWVKGKTCSALANRLCRYYRKAGGNLAFLPVLWAFLECSLEYLRENAMEEDFSFLSLDKHMFKLQISTYISAYSFHDI